MSGPDHPPRRRRPTVRDVARTAGVSVAVVSYTFNRPERVASATRERVLAAAAAIGYKGPDPAARALRLGRHGAVALIGPKNLEHMFADPGMALIARGVARACDQAGISLVLPGAREPGVDGAVLIGAAAATWRGATPAVVVGDEDARLDGVPLIQADVHGGAAELAAHLAQLGHRNLAVITWPGAATRLAGLRAGWGQTGPVHAYEVSHPLRAHGEAAARAALHSTPRPDALVAVSDQLALGALDALRFAGLQAPEDLSVAGMDDLPGSDRAGLTTVFVPYRPMGDLAGGVLAAALDGHVETAPPPLPTALAVRTSTAPRPA